METLQSNYAIYRSQAHVLPDPKRDWSIDTRKARKGYHGFPGAKNELPSPATVHLKMEIAMAKAALEQGDRVKYRIAELERKLGERV